MTHRPEDIGTPAEDVQVVVHGHTHIPREERIGNVLYLNPGSPSKPRGGSRKSIARISIEVGKVSGVEFVALEGVSS